MVIEIGKIPEGERIWDEVLSLDGDLTSFFALNKSIVITLETQRRRSKISCLVKYKTDVACVCSRCLQEFQYEIESTIRFFVVHESETCEDDEDFDFYHYKSGNEKIDFTQTVYNDIVTQIPMKPLCRDNCVGIDLEIEENGNENEQWNVLKKLIK
jgi:uncharacterized protein